MDSVMWLAIGIPLALMAALFIRTYRRGGKIGLEHISTMITVCVLGALAFVLYKAEVINWITTYESVTAMAGTTMAYGTNWPKVLADLVVILDIASLVAVFTPQSKFADEPILVKTIVSLWAISVIADMFGTWYFAALQQQSGTVRAPASISAYTWIFPLAITILITGVQVGILRVFGLVLEMAINGRLTTSLRKASSNYFPPVKSKPISFDSSPGMSAAERHGHSNADFLQKMGNNNREKVA